MEKRVTAVKRLRPAETAFLSGPQPLYAALAAEIRAAHQDGTLTLVVMNTVERAQELFRALRKGGGDSALTLLHSRFRPHERDPLIARVLKTNGDHIVVSTQVIEAGAIWAKSGSSAPLRFGRKHFRHELVSALAWRAHAGTDPVAALVTFLIAAHHGKVRLAVRALPGEREPEESDRLFARGVWEGDTLPALTLCGETRPETTLSLAAMRLGLGTDGQPSWLECSLALHDAPDLGPFRLAYLETLLRAADMRASAASEIIPPQP